MSECRFMYGNKITSQAMLTVSSEKSGITGTAVKEGLGSASCEVVGVYAGAGDLLYTVEIDSVSAGAEVGEATFRWKDGGESWDGSGVATSTSAVSLNNGLSVKFTAGAGDDFAVADKWTFLARKPFGKATLVDLDRNTELRTAQVDNPTWIKADLGSAQNVKAFMLCDHNVRSTGTITLEANTADSWSSPPYSQQITWNEGIVCLFLNETYRWWRVKVGDSGNPDGHIRASELYLGDYKAFTYARPVMPGRKFHVMHEMASRSEVGVERRQFFGRRHEWSLRIVYRIKAEFDEFAALFAALRQPSLLRTVPCFFTPDKDVPASTFLVYLDEALEEKGYLDTMESNITCWEAVRANV